jgi:hypothetical protein
MIPENRSPRPSTRMRSAEVGVRNEQSTLDSRLVFRLQAGQSDSAAKEVN